MIESTAGSGSIGDEPRFVWPASNNCKNSHANVVVIALESFHVVQYTVVKRSSAASIGELPPHGLDWPLHMEAQNFGLEKVQHSP